MLLQILKGTPPWVFGLFFALLAIGFAQTRSRDVSAGRLAILPAAFIAFSLFGVIAAFGAQPVDLTMAMNPGLAREAVFAAGASLVHGLLSGAFLARALRVFALRPAAPAHSVQSA